MAQSVDVKCICSIDSPQQAVDISLQKGGSLLRYPIKLSRFGVAYQQEEKGNGVNHTWLAWGDPLFDLKCADALGTLTSMCRLAKQTKSNQTLLSQMITILPTSLTKRRKSIKELNVVKIAA